jgi:hypothetical protein
VLAYSKCAADCAVPSDALKNGVNSAELTIQTTERRTSDFAALGQSEACAVLQAGPHPQILWSDRGAMVARARISSCVASRRNRVRRIATPQRRMPYSLCRGSLGCAMVSSSAALIPCRCDRAMIGRFANQSRSTDGMWQTSRETYAHVGHSVAVFVHDSSADPACHGRYEACV